MSLRAVLVLTSCAAFAAGLFVFLHSGSRAVALCGERGFASLGSLSWWPPGARCVGGEPGFEVTRFQVAYVPVLVFGLPLLAMLLTALGRCRATP